jgi:hypothetical protein|uniref:DUF6291 domain-containing protein n=1 Tax=Siphoviridae sp. ctS1E53 TaxID=2826340 RepID=A0A8S5MF37_9CAUD|nr:MAG TPA: hypothetical protein [Siphoviridae sp. ctS1E53]
MKYLKVFTDFASSLAPLSDAECGRLFKAMLEYAMSGQEPDLRGNERFVWPSAKASIDRDQQTYDRKAEGARKAARKRTSTISYDIVQEKSISYDIVQDKDKDKDKDKEEEERARAREGMTAPAPFMTPEECDAAAQQYDRVKNTLVRVGIQPTLQAMDTAMGLLADYGEERLLAALRTASDHDRKGGVNWPFVRRILEDKPRPAEESKSLYEIPFIQDGEVIR